MVKVDGPSMDAGLGSWTAYDTHRLTRPLAGARVGLGALPAHGQATQVPDATIRLNALQSLQVHADLPAQIALNDIFAVLNGVDYLGELLLGQILGAYAGINIRLGQNDLCVARADAINVAQGDVDALVRRDFHTNDTSHILLNR